MRKITYLLLCLLIGIGLVTAQTRRVTGVVISADDGEPVIGASVVVKGATTTGTVTDVDGRFELNVPSNANTLVVSYIGMITQDAAVSQTMRVVLQSDTQQLDEVVVTALGMSRDKKSLGYAAQEIKSDELTGAGQQNLVNSLSGKIAGVQITAQGGQIGASQNIVIRGNSSFGSNQPLFVIDGVPVTNDNSTGSTINLGSGINDINPNDIESISVLKGGAAALYGMRAGNGVVLITTKSGQRNSGVTLSYDGDYTVEQVYGLPKFQNKYGQGYYASEFDYKDAQAGGFSGSYQDFASQFGFGYLDGYGGGVNDNADESWGPRLDIGLMLPQFNSPVVNGERQATPWVSHPNNVKDFFIYGHTTSHTISLSSSSERANTRASISYRGQTGTSPNTNLDRYAAYINNQYKLNDYIDFDMAVNYVRTTSGNLPGTGYNATNPAQSLLQWFGRQVDMKAIKDNWDQKDAEGNYTMYNWNLEYHDNPYYVAYRNTNKYQRDRTFGKSSLWWKPTDWLKFEGRIGIDQFNSRQLSVREESTDFPLGYFREYNRHTREINADFIAYFNKNFGDLNINALAGANYRDYEYGIKQTGGDELVVKGLYTASNVKGSPYVEENHELRRSNSVYGSVSFGWKNQAYLDVTARNDWDSTIDEPF
ncbi:MAG: SusC/RagA family TonB-linked outer membrane protein, partial [Tannerella sp.]|nr:SusC/RagA family TonB-linked outer membrane protein [Tannerella sp.]